MKITKITCENIPAITTVFGLIVTYTTKISNLEYMHVYMWVSISVYKCKCLRIGNINNIHLFTTCCCWCFFLPLCFIFYLPLRCQCDIVSHTVVAVIFHFRQSFTNCLWNDLSEIPVVFQLQRLQFFFI